jgi:hypothetical protein
VGQHHVRALVEHLDAALEQVAPVQVVVRGPLPQLAAALGEHEVVVRRGADVLRQPQVADP